VLILPVNVISGNITAGEFQETQPQADYKIHITQPQADNKKHNNKLIINYITIR